MHRLKNLSFLILILGTLLITKSAWARPGEPVVRLGKDKPVYARFGGNQLLNISEFPLPLTNSIKVINTLTGKTEYLRADKGVEIRVVGKVGGEADDLNRGMYEIKIIRNGVTDPGIYLTSPQNVKGGINWYSVEKTIEGLDDLKKGSLLRVFCLTSGDSNSSPQQHSDSHGPAVFNEDEGTIIDDIGDVRPSTYVEPSPGEFHEGCEALAEQPVPEEITDKLLTCVESLREAIVAGNRSSGGLNRAGVFKAMFSRLKPEEQVFAAHIFTGYGEAAGWTTKENPEEAMFVMRVLQNRKRMALDQGATEPYNELDVALHTWQFSMYNANDPNWQRVLDPSQNLDFSGVVEAYRRMSDPELSQFEPVDELNNVSHYHRDYLDDPWPSSSGKTRVYPKINGEELRHGRHGPGGYNLIYRNVDGRNNWAYVESSRGEWRE